MRRSLGLCRLTGANLGRSLQPRQVRPRFDDEAAVGCTAGWQGSSGTLRPAASGAGHSRAATARLCARKVPSEPHRHRPAAPAALPLNEGPPDRRRLYGRLAAMFFTGSGVVGLVTLPLPAPGSEYSSNSGGLRGRAGSGFSDLACAMGEMAQAGQPGIVPPAFALIALGNVFGGADLHTYGVFFVVAFVWIGIAHPPRTSAAMAPLAAAAYILPLFFLPGSIGAGLSSAAITIPVCVLVGEGIAWGVGRLEQIELALARERDRTEQLRELDEMKDRFLSAVSHELRTPITICRGHLEVLRRGGR